MKTFDTASFQLTDSQRALIEELYPVINDEFKADATIQVAFQKALLQPNKKLAFVTAINPIVMEMAKALGSPLIVPLAAIISRTLADEWLATEVFHQPAPDEIDPELAKAITRGSPLTRFSHDHANPQQVSKEPVVEQDPYLKGIEERGVSPTIYGWSQEDPHFQEVPKERIVGASPAFAAPYGNPAEIMKVDSTGNSTFQGEIVLALDDGSDKQDLMRPTMTMEDATATSVPQKDDPIILPKLAKGSTGQDRSRPVLSVAVLRGLEDLLGEELHTINTKLKGRPDARLAIKYLKRLLAFGQKREADKKNKG